MSRRPSDPTSLEARRWKVGELAERTGLTVRTLHHYDAIGLLSPSARTRSEHGSGHRLYTVEDVSRLQQIVSLRMLGFPLESIREYLARDDYDPRQIVRLHLDRVRGQAAELKRLESRLTALADALDRAEIVSADEFLTTIEEMTMFEKYYTPDQIEYLTKRADEIGEEAMREAPEQWAKLLADVQKAVDDGLDPSDPKAQELVRRWIALVNAFTGGDPGILQSLKRMYQNEETIQGMDVAAMRPGMQWIEKAAQAGGLVPPA